jgi:translation elongation factor EF-G
MAPRKKKAKAKKTKTVTRKPPAQKKTAKVKKKTVARAAPARKTKKPSKATAAPPKRTVAAATTPPPAKPAAPPRPSVTAKPAPTPTPAASAAGPGEERIGVVTHYYTHLGVAVVRLETGTLRVGDTIHIRGHTSDFRQKVESMQIEHQPVTEVRAGQEFGLKVVEHAREHDVVFKVTSP